MELYSVMSVLYILHSFSEQLDKDVLQRTEYYTLCGMYCRVMHTIYVHVIGFMDVLVW